MGGAYTSPATQRKQDTRAEAERIEALGPKVGELLPDYIEAKIAKSRTDAVAGVWSSSGVLYDRLADMHITKITRKTVAELIEYMQKDAPRWGRNDAVKGLAPNTVRLRIGAVSEFFKWAIVHEHTDKNPTVDVDRPKVVRGDPDPLSPREWEPILAEARGPHWPEWAKYMIQVQLGLGMDISDVCYIERADLGRDRAQVKLKRRKTQKKYTAELSGTIRAIFDRQVPHTDGYIFHDEDGENFASRRRCKYAASTIRKIIRAAGVKARGKSLRHSMATWRALAGQTPYKIKSAMGHTGLEMTSHYIEDLERCWVRYLRHGRPVARRRG